MERNITSLRGSLGLSLPINEHFKLRPILTFTISDMQTATAVKGLFYVNNNPIMSVNGSKIKKTYQLELKAGENSLVIVYNTYQYDYFCTFSWLATAGIIYEVTDQENQYPLTLYRWHKKNALWTIRMDPVDPLECRKKSG